MSNRMSRRGFLKKGAALGTALAFPTIIPATALGQGGRPAPSNRVVMGAVGVGWQGMSNMNNFLGRNDVQMVAVCDLDQRHLREAANRVNTVYGNQDCAMYADFNEMYARGDLDAVVLSLPDHWHALAGIAAARAGLDIFGEKPFTHTLREGRALVNAIERYGRIWQTGSWQRSTSNFHRACELVRNGRIGKVHRVEVLLGGGHIDYEGNRNQQTPQDPPAHLDYERWLGPAPWAPYCPARVHKNWRWVLDTGGGQMMDWIGHHGDIAHWALDLDHTGPVEIEGTGTCDSNGIWDTPTSYEISCRYANGLEMIVSSRNNGGTIFHGEKGMIHVNRGLLTADPASILDEVIGPDEIQLYRSVDHWGNFVECVKSRRPTITPAETAHRSASIGHLCTAAIMTGRKIRWNPDTEELVGDQDAERWLSHAYRAPYVL